MGQQANKMLKKMAIYCSSFKWWRSLCLQTILSLRFIWMFLFAYFPTIELFPLLSSVNQLLSPDFGDCCSVLANSVYSRNLVCHLFDPRLTAIKRDQIDSVVFHVWFHLSTVQLEAMKRRETDWQRGMCWVCGVRLHAMYIFCSSLYKIGFV